MVRRLVLILFAAISLVANAYEVNPDWLVHKSCQNDSRTNQNYCLDIVELDPNHNQEEKIILLIPGITQNAHIWDLDPENEISVARYIQKTSQAKVYILNPRTVGESDYVPYTNLDDFSIDDIPNAINFLYEKYQKKITVIGHSQGAINLGASMSGLTRCEKRKNCFQIEIANERQSKVKSIGFLAGDSRMKIERKNPVYLIARFYRTIRFTLRYLDKVDIETLTRTFRGLGHLDLWHLLAREQNTTDEIKVKLLDKTVQATSKYTLDQFTLGVTHGNIKSKGGSSYADNLKNISIPTYQQVFDKDYLAFPKTTKKNSFDYIGSDNKIFEIIPNQAHEDFFMNKTLHKQLDPMLNFLLEN